MKEVNFETFKAWIDEVYPEVDIIEEHLSLAGMYGPAVTEEGIETEEDDLPWDYNAREIEWKAQDLLEGPDSDEIDFREEAEDLLRVAKKVREKLVNLGKNEKETPSDYIRGKYDTLMVPFKKEYVVEIGSIVSDFFFSILDDSETSRQTYKDWLEK